MSSRCAAGQSIHALGLEPTYVCADVQTGTIRFIQAQQFVVTRNRVGKFGNVLVALNTEIEWERVTAIKGQITSLQSFHPGEASVELIKPQAAEDAKATQPASVRISGGVVAGNKIGGPAPTYPESARQRHLSGTVILLAEITKSGTVANLFPMASPDPMFTQAAMDAVRKWTYKPYLLNGLPVSVSTTVTVNFNMNLPG